jgi:hypothetical protein
MEPEGMVHALEEIHRSLKPSGTLIEIHPAVEPPPFVEVRSGGGVAFSEQDPAFDYADDSRHAETAIATLTERRIFAVDEPRRFELRTHAGSVAEMRDYWTVYDAYSQEVREEALVRRKDEMYGRAAVAMEGSPGADIVFVEPAMMTKLTPLP